MDEVIIKEIVEESTDLNPRDQEYISNLIHKNLPDPILLNDLIYLSEAHVYEIVVAAAYLYSKCPGNSDKAVDYKVAALAIKKTHGHNGASLINGIKYVKELGFIPEYCVVTSTVILRNMKNDESNKQYDEILDAAIEISESEKVRKLRQGKSPSVVAAACFYYASLMENSILTQSDIVLLFNVTEVSLRNFWRHIKPEDDKKRKDLTNRKSNAPRVQCKNCEHVGDKMPKRRVLIISRVFGYEYKNISPGWKCLNDGTTYGHISSLTYRRICFKYKPKVRGGV